MKKVRWLMVLCLILLICIIFNVYSSEVKYVEAPLNEVVDVGTEVYVQHNESNQDVYLLTSEGEQTVVYEVLNVKYTASKQWTRDGLYIDDSTGKIGATAPEDYIPVKEGEVYFVRLYGIGDVYKGENGDEWHITTPIVYFDDEGNCVGHALSSTVSASKAGVEITIPASATRMYISNYNNQTITIQRKHILNSDEFAILKAKQDEILNYVDTNYESIQNDPVIYENLDKGYITFVNDDSRPDVDVFADLFISKDVPLVYAAIADNLLNNASNLTETRVDVALRVQNAGGEVLAHSGPVITESTINDNNFMYNYYVVQKQLLTRMGFNVNGIIMAGGSGQISNNPTTAKWASAVYKYADLLGEKYDTSSGIDSVYYHPRGGLAGYYNDIDKLKAAVDDAILNKKWTVFYFHDKNEITAETMSALLDYINTFADDELEVVTYHTMYENFANRESNVKEKVDPITVTFTIDDSYKDSLTYVKPYFDKYGFKASVAVVRDLVQQSTAGQNNWYLTESDIKELYNSGWEILAHGLDLSNSSDGSNIFATARSENVLSQSGYTVEQEIVESKAYLESFLGEGSVKGFAIPNLYMADDYSYLLKNNYQYAIGSGSSYSNYAHARTKFSNMLNINDKIADEAQTIADNMIRQIDNAIANGDELNIYFHITDGFVQEISWQHYDCNLAALDIVLEYLRNKQDEGVVNVQLPSEAYAVKSSSTSSKTYYVSSNGTGSGTVSTDPMNLDVLEATRVKPGDIVLFKSGDVFFDTLEMNVSTVGDAPITISSYGEGELPTFSSYKYVNKNWELYSDNIYRIDIKNTNNFTGYISNDTKAFNVGFIEDDNGVKYYNKKVNIENLTSTYDFYSDGSQYLYMYLDRDPYEVLGGLKVVVRSNLMTLSSNMEISNLKFSYTGGHALAGSSGSQENIIIKDCIIENIGGSYLYSSSLSDETRYGNGIEFYGVNVKNVDIYNNIFRNTYDVAFTIQGNAGSGTNIFVHNNVFINNSQDSEIWENQNATGVYNYQFYDNVSINQGRGWGYEARPEKYPAASILFWGYEIDHTDILFTKNYFYNPRQIYYFAVATDTYFLNTDTIKTDYNTFYMSSDTKIYRNTWDYNTRSEFIVKYAVDHNSTFEYIEPKDTVTNVANVSNDINELRLLVLGANKVISSVELNGFDSISINEGETLNIDNYSLRVTYKDGQIGRVNLNSSMLSNINYSLFGVQEVSVSYLGFMTKFNLEILELPKTPEVAPEEDDIVQGDVNQHPSIDNSHQDNNLNQDNNLEVVEPDKDVVDDNSTNESDDDKDNEGVIKPDKEESSKDNNDKDKNKTEKDSDRKNNNENLEDEESNESFKFIIGGFIVVVLFMIFMLLKKDNKQSV